MRSIFLALWVVLACAGAPAAAQQAQSVIAAERAFAARGAEIGWVEAFLEYAAPEALLGQPGYPNAHEALAGTGHQGRLLYWWPAFAAIARSGDIGFTTGPFSMDQARTPVGQYFTIWRRQPDGRWKWIYDGGVGPISAADQLIGLDDPHVYEMMIADRGLGPARALEAVRALEAQGDLERYLAADSLVFRSRRPRVIGGGGAFDPSAEYVVSHAEASAAGDMAFLLGVARSPAPSGEVQEALFARVWQLRKEGWRIIYDHLVIPRRPPAG